MLRLKVWTWALAVWAASTYVLCIVWGMVTPDTIHTEALEKLLETVLPGFRWLTPLGFLIGLVESFLYGAYAGLLFVPLHNLFYRRWGR